MTKEAPKVVVVYGALRSGTTLLRLMLDQHPSLSCPGETDFLFDHIRKGSGGGWEFDLEALRRDRIYRSHCALYGVSPDADVPSVDKILSRMGAEGQTVVLMLHRHLGRALEVFPGLPVIHMIRDPRDVARSSIGMGWAGNVYFGVLHWLNTEREWDGVAPRIAENQALTLRYEELILNPEAELERLCRFVGRDYRDSMLDYESGTTYSRPDASLTYQWKRKQTPHEVGLVEGQVGAMLTARGYAPSGHPVVTPGLAEQLVLRFQNRRDIWARKFRRFGVVDPVLVTLANRTGIAALGHGAQRRIDEKMVDYMK